jgi:hypothetical protein
VAALAAVAGDGASLAAAGVEGAFAAAGDEAFAAAGEAVLALPLEDGRAESLAWCDLGVDSGVRADSTTWTDFGVGSPSPPRRECSECSRVTPRRLAPSLLEGMGIGALRAESKAGYREDKTGKLQTGETQCGKKQDKGSCFFHTL